MATYYVAQGGTAANKAAATTGTHPGGCMSPAVHNGETFSAGDTVVLASDGGNITDQVIPPSSGSSGSPIVYQGDGSTVLDGGDLEDHIFETSSKSYLTIKDFEAIDCTDSNLWISRGSNIIIENIVAHGGQTIRTNSVDNLIVRKCNVYGSDYNGIYIGSTNYGGADCSVALVEDCYVHDCAHNGIDIHTNEYGASMSDVTVRRCWVEGNINNGIYCTAGGNEIEILHDVKIYNNVVINNTLAGINPNYLGAGDAVVDGCLIYGNFVYGNGTWGVNCWATDAEIKNNAIWGNGSELKANSNGDASIVADYNIIHESGGDVSGIVSWEGVNRTYAAWVSTDGQNTNGSFEDPGVTNAAIGDFTLPSDSACIGAAVNLGSPYDIGILPGSTWPGSVLTGDRDDY